MWAFTTHNGMPNSIANSRSTYHAPHITNDCAFAQYYITSSLSKSLFATIDPQAPTCSRESSSPPDTLIQGMLLVTLYTNSPAHAVWHTMSAAIWSTVPVCTVCLVHEVLAFKACWDTWCVHSQCMSFMPVCRRVSVEKRRSESELRTCSEGTHCSTRVREGTSKSRGGVWSSVVPNPGWVVLAGASLREWQLKGSTGL